MFTGLVEEIGTVEKTVKKGGGLSFAVSAKILFDDLKIGDSVNVNGVCQTVVKISKNIFEFDTIGETITKTTLGKLKAKDKVNLERSLTPSSRMGGHIVLGHTDTTGKIINIKNDAEGIELTIKFPEEFSMYLVHVGSITIDGISLTVASNKDDVFTVAVIPHTWKETILVYKKAGDSVNLEFDILGKYAYSILSAGKKQKIDMNMLRKFGFLNDEN
jgi:riboflavin synthase, alpha subunit